MKLDYEKLTSLFISTSQMNKSISFFSIDHMARIDDSWYSFHNKPINETHTVDLTYSDKGFLSSKNITFRFKISDISSFEHFTHYIELSIKPDITLRIAPNMDSCIFFEKG